MEKPRADTQAIGRAAEEAAALYYARAGFQPIARNFRTRGSEIDLVLFRAGVLLFVEVKGRAGDWVPHAWSPGWRGKQRRLRGAMREFLARNPDWKERAEEIFFEIVFVTQGRVKARYREA